MQDLTKLSANKIIESLPREFIEENIDELEKYIQEVSNKRWCVYTIEEYSSNNDCECYMLNCVIRNTSKELAKDAIINKIMKEVADLSDEYLTERLEEYEDSMVETGLLEYEIPKPEDDPYGFHREYIKMLIGFFQEYMNIEDGSDYEFNSGCWYFFVSCHSDAILKWTDKLQDEFIDKPHRYS